MWRPAVFFVALALCAALASADLSLHNPPGSNNRNRERNNNRNNPNRLFDSSNNANGGYPWRGDATADGPDPITYYEGSILPIQWTAPRCDDAASCSVVIQMAYGARDTGDDALSDFRGLRDGYPQGTVVASDDSIGGYFRRNFSQAGGQNDHGTHTIPSVFSGNETVDDEFYFDGLHGGVEFGLHESHRDYAACQASQRNKGLFTSDQILNRNDGRSTRHNPSGARRGFECPEERDYYPYWRPSKWRDVAILTTDPSGCAGLVAESQNTKAFGFCTCPADDCDFSTTDNLLPIYEAACVVGGGVWDAGSSKGIDAPACEEMPTPDNAGVFTFNWRVPVIPGGLGVARHAVLRVRFNSTSSTYPSTLDESENCPASGGTPCAAEFPGTRPYVDVFGAGNELRLGLAVSSQYLNRVFQDRSHLFRISPRPGSLPVNATVLNLNVVGRRGNTEQTFPALEYRFAPRRIEVESGDEDVFLHIQLHGSDFNAPNGVSNGQGWRYSDRFNLLQADSPSSVLPLAVGDQTLFADAATARLFGLLGQDTDPMATCSEFENGDADENDSPENCGRLNAAPARFPQDPEDGLVPVSTEVPREVHFFCSRNTNVGFRSLRGVLAVTNSTMSDGGNSTDVSDMSDMMGGDDDDDDDTSGGDSGGNSTNCDPGSNDVLPAGNGKKENSTDTVLVALVAVMSVLLVAVTVGAICYVGKHAPATWAGPVYASLCGCCGQPRRPPGDVVMNTAM